MVYWGTGEEGGRAASDLAEPDRLPFGLGTEEKNELARLIILTLLTALVLAAYSR